MIAYEMFQFCNTDIADTLFDPDTGILRDTEIARIWSQVVGYNNGTMNEDDMDEYEIGPVVLSASNGDGGTLYGYESEPLRTDGTAYEFVW